MSILHRILLIALLLPFLAAGGVALWWMEGAALAKEQEKAFDAIVENSPRDAVIATLGQPDSVRPCGENLWWGGDPQYRGPNDGRCVTEERYEYLLTAYGIGYSAAGTVVSKYRYVSE